MIQGRVCLAEWALTAMISVSWMDTKVWLASGYILIILLTRPIKYDLIPFPGHVAIFSAICHKAGKNSDLCCPLGKIRNQMRISDDGCKVVINLSERDRLGPPTTNVILLFYWMNPYIKNCRTGFHDDILNRTSHYLKLLSTKSSIANRHDHNYLFLLKQNRSKELNEERVSGNLKLMNSLIDIDRRLSNYVETDRNVVRRRASMKTEYEVRQKKVSLSKDNLRLFKKLTCIESDISQDKMRKFDEDITRYSNLIRHPCREVVEMDDRLFETYRQELGKTKTSPNKEHRMVTEDDRRAEVKPFKSKRRHRLRKIAKQSREGQSPAKDNPEFKKD